MQFVHLFMILKLCIDQMKFRLHSKTTSKYDWLAKLIDGTELHSKDQSCLFEVKNNKTNLKRTVSGVGKSFHRVNFVIQSIDR